ncbi:MAG TPA: M28 family peptidase [Acidobacteriota bacterium]|nr:M28 family peptidase [Acidobacteriota bacterium]
MPAHGWKRLFTDAKNAKQYRNHRIDAYSEFMPAPHLGVKPYGTEDEHLFAKDDPWGWPVTEAEEFLEFRPGLEKVAHQIAGALVHLGCGEAAHGIAKNKLMGNPCWPPELGYRAGFLRHERYVLILPLAFSRTQDDKGRIRWTLFGGSEQGPSSAFWNSFFTAPNRELREEHSRRFIQRLLAAAYGESLEPSSDLRQEGFRILPEAADSPSGNRSADQLPGWTESCLLRTGDSLRSVKYILTFQPFASLPEQVRRAYLSGELHLLPFPGSLIFWNVPDYLRLGRELPLAMQIPLLHLAARHEGPGGLRIPQSGWMHEPRQGVPPPERGPIRNSYMRTHRWARILRHQDELLLLGREDKLAHVLFSADPGDVELYGKPMARNVQLWSHDHHLLLDGPRASRAEIHKAIDAVAEGGLFGYRFQYPAMRVGPWEVYWQRPLVAYLSRETGVPTVMPDAPSGYITAYHSEHPRPNRSWRLWPRILQREPQSTALRVFEHNEDALCHHLCLESLRLLHAKEMFGTRQLPRSFARCLLTLSKQKAIEDWFLLLEEHARDREEGRQLARSIAELLEPDEPAAPAESLTFSRSARRSFEVQCWKNIARLAEGWFVNKDNADCVRDPVTHSKLKHHHRDLEALGDYLLDHYRRSITACGMRGRAVAGDLPFRWQTDFDFNWMGGWLRNQRDEIEERNLIVVIPGRDRGRAVIMADHYDTAYMEDVYDKTRGGSGARLAAAGADDNHSGTTALMQAAPILLELSRKGRLGCDVWLVHLTGEEFPSDCMGARYLCQRLVQRNLQLRLPKGRKMDLSRVRVAAAFVLDMVGHNNERDRDVFQISPGTGPESMNLALLAHGANETWNRMTRQWNKRASRRGRTRGVRSPDGRRIPEIALHPELHGEVRLPADPRSTLYNTDGQIFSDAGVPVVLFMENYDINRTGYHDTKDTMANIDLDYCSALIGIAIESVAQAATQSL